MKLTELIDSAKERSIYITNCRNGQWYQLGRMTEDSFWIESNSSEGVQVSSNSLYELLDKFFVEVF